MLFTDLVGSTAMRQELGDDRADELRRHHDRIVRESLTAHGGTEVKATGDGFMMVFGASAEAIAAATELQRAVLRFNRRSPAPLALRIGISAGDVVWERGDCFGTPVVEASRLCDAAEGGQVLAADVVRILAGSRGGHSQRFVAVGALTLKGLADPLPAVEVTWEPDPAADSGDEGIFPLPAALAGTETVAFVGRQDERLLLANAWKHARSGERQVVLISGEPGVGKTRLAAETARLAYEQGAIVLLGGCDDDLAIPYQPFVEALDAYVARCPADQLADQLGGDGGRGGELARLLPRIAQKVSGLPEPLRAEPETERFHLFEAVRDFVASISATTPLVLVFDDIHWAAKPTLLLLRHLVRLDPRHDLPLLVLATYRDTELGRDHPLADVLADLRREPAVERVALKGLSADDVDSFVEAAAGHNLDEEGHRLARAVHAETEGNPFFVGQVLRHLVESGSLRNVDGRWEATPGARIGIPEGVREVIGQRLSRLSPSANSVLAAAAVVGREFDASLLAALELDREEVVLDALEEAEQSRLIHGVAARPGRYTFAHALVRSTLYDELSTVRRLRLHRNVAETLAAASGPADTHAEEVARHYCECAPLGEEENAVRHGTRAARRALERLAYEEAAAWFERVLAVLDPDRVDVDTRAGLLIEMGRAQYCAGDVAAARGPLEEALTLARGARRPELFTLAALALGGRRGWTEAGVVDESLIDHLEEALTMLPPGDSPLRAQAAARLASELYFRAGEHERRMQLALDAVAMARRCADPDALAAVLVSAVFGRWVPDSARERIGLAREIVALSEESGDLEIAVNGWGWVHTALFELGDLDGVRAAQSRIDALAEQLRMPVIWWMAGVKGAALALFEGRIDESAALMDAAYEQGQRAQLTTALQMFGVAQMDLAHLRGEVETLAPLAHALADEYPSIPAWRAGEAFVHAEAGNLADARRAFEVLAADDFATIPRDANWHPGVCVLACVAEFLGDAARGAVLYDLLLPYADDFIIAGTPAVCFGSGHWALGLAAAAAGRLDTAVDHLAIAVERNEAAGSPGWTARARMDLARVLARRRQPGDDDTQRAGALLSACLAVCGQYGFPGLAARAEAVRSEL